MKVFMQYLCPHLIIIQMIMQTIILGTQQVQTYQTPYFTDPSRVSKVLALRKEIESLYSEYAQKYHFPGYAYGVVVDNQLVMTGGNGFLDLKKKYIVNNESMFRIASMTKSFTAMAVLKLRDDNKLKLDDPIHLYIPEIQNLKLPLDAPQITIRDLLTHSAGFPTDDPWADRKLQETEEQFTELLKKGVFFAHTPGTTYEYSNLGYTLLGYIIHKITGISYEEYINQYILQPLQIQDMQWDYTKVSALNLANGYSWINNDWKEEELLKPGIFGAMGGLIASIKSFSQYVSFHLAAWPPRDDFDTGHPIKRSSLREMQQPWNFRSLLVDQYPDGQQRIISSSYGYGLIWLKDNLERVYVGHSGGLPGFGSNWWIMPEYGVGVILFANVTYAPAFKINLDILDVLIKKAGLNPRQIPASDIMKDRKKALVQLLPEWKNALASPIFADNFFLDQSLDALKEESLSLFHKAGKIKTIHEVVSINALKGSFIVEGEKLNLKIKFSLTPDNPPLIQKYQIQEVNMR
ncbi:MAG: beta-lactamase family protein [Chlamydiales bacterium]|nr:beta-lactamase family protein [Chlamydiales bacterium]